MKLIGTPTSPYTRKARVVLAEKRIDYDFIVDAPYDASTRVAAHNPLGKVQCWCSMTTRRYLIRVSLPSTSTTRVP